VVLKKKNETVDGGRRRRIEKAGRVKKIRRC